MSDHATNKLNSEPGDCWWCGESLEEGQWVFCVDCDSRAKRLFGGAK